MRPDLPGLFVLGLLIAVPERAMGQSCADLFWVGGAAELSDEKSLLTHYAPEFLQFVEDPRGTYYLDFLAKIDFDGDFNAHNNWDNADDYREPVANVYGAVLAVTANQVYLLYYYFHARDYESSWAGRHLLHPISAFLGFPAEHENDLEGGMLVVDRETGAIIHAHALAHNNFDERHLAVENLDRHRPTVVWIEAGGHGGHLLPRDALRALEPNRDCLVRYRGTSEAPTTTKGDIACGWPEAWVGAKVRDYRVSLLWDLFARLYREQDDRTLLPATELFAEPFPAGSMRFKDYQEVAAPQLDVYRALKGLKRGRYKAKFPWGQGDDYHRFFDPVDRLLAIEDQPHRDAANHPPGHQLISIEYLYNPYLYSTMKGSVRERRASLCTSFPSEWNFKRNKSRKVAEPGPAGLLWQLRRALGEYREQCGGYPQSLDRLLPNDSGEGERDCNRLGSIQNAIEAWGLKQFLIPGYLDSLRDTLFSSEGLDRREGYTFRYRTSIPLGESLFARYQIQAQPSPAGRHGFLSYWLSEVGDIRWRADGPAGPADEKLDW